MMMDTDDNATDPPDMGARVEAMRFAWQLFVEEMNIKEFRALSIENQLALAGNAGLDIDGLMRVMRVMRFMAEYHLRHEEALKQYLEQRKPAH